MSRSCASGSRSSLTRIFPARNSNYATSRCYPHFSFNIRCGDSLVQEIGGMNLSQIRADFSEIPRSLKARTTRLKNEKLKFFDNDRTCLYNSEQELKQEEQKALPRLL